MAGEQSKFYSVEWPKDWRVLQLATSPVTKGEFSNVLSFEGGSPQKQVTTFQHAIVVSKSSEDKLIEEIKKREADSNSQFVEETSVQVNSYKAKKLLFENKVDKTNKQSYYVINSNDLRFVIIIHGPSNHATYLNEAADLILKSFQIKK